MALTKHSLKFNATVGNCDEVKSFLYTGDGTQLTQTGGALDVNIASGTISITEQDNYAEDSAHTSGDTGGFILSLRADSLAAVPAGNLADTEGDYQAFITGPNGELFVGGNDFDIRDLSAAQDNVAISDGTDTLAVNADGSINTQATLAGSAFIDDRLKVVDCFDSIAVSSPVLAAATATDVTAVANQVYLEIQNEGDEPVYLGPSGTVTAATGICIPCGGTWAGKACGTVALISTPGTAAGDVRVAQYAV